MDIKKVMVWFLSILIGWDVLTTYFGSVSILDYHRGFSDTPFFERLPDIPLMVHIVSMLLGLGLIAVILGYKQILRSRNNVTRPLLFVAFVYDFGTSFYGTGRALELQFNNFAQLGIILILVLIVASAPMIISQVLED